MANNGSRRGQAPKFPAMFASQNNGSTSVLNFEEMNSLIQQDEEDELDELFHQPGKKRRLTVDQVQFLEKSFEVENKLEPERKLQLAKDLNLQPRQVAIWFQNRRARWKTKQLEKDYDGLVASFNTLQNDYDLVLKEKENLKLEVEKLKNMLIAKGNGGLESEKGMNDNVQSKSDNSDSDSPHCADGVPAVDSSHNFEQEQSDLSQDEDDGFKEGLLNLPCVFPKLEDAVYSTFEDSSFWSWSFA